LIRRNVLIFHSGGLGDFLLTWPLGLALGRLHPQSRIFYVTQASKGALAAAALRLDSLDAETGWPALYADSANPDDRLRKILAESHSVYTFLATPGDAFFRNVTHLSPQAQITPLQFPPPPDFLGHATEYLLTQLSAVPAVRGAVDQIMASIAAKGVGTTRHNPAGPILIHPGSGNVKKCYPIPGLLDVVKKMTQHGKTAKLVLGEAELERFSKADIARLEQAAPVVRPPRYVDLLTEMNAASAFLGNDSGPTHLAAMTGLPTVALFGPTNPLIWRPLGPKVAVLEGRDFSALTADDIWSVMHRLLDS
jgi:ADP-heptose:LPS heptosyltransferase